ncbi:hypothetical protein T439DRAFT_335159 [Meredithblackwellia eburnea MCA 4105]
MPFYVSSCFLLWFFFCLSSLTAIFWSSTGEFSHLCLQPNCLLRSADPPAPLRSPFRPITPLAHQTTQNDMAPLLTPHGAAQWTRNALHIHRGLIQSTAERDIISLAELEVACPPMGYRHIALSREEAKPFTKVPISILPGVQQWFSRYWGSDEVTKKYLARNNSVYCGGEKEAETKAESGEYLRDNGRMSLLYDFVGAILQDVREIRSHNAYLETTSKAHQGLICEIKKTFGSKELKEFLSPNSLLFESTLEQNPRVNPSKSHQICLKSLHDTTERMITSLSFTKSLYRKTDKAAYKFVSDCLEVIQDDVNNVWKSYQRPVVGEKHRDFDWGWSKDILRAFTILCECVLRLERVHVTLDEYDKKRNASIPPVVSANLLGRRQAKRVAAAVRAERASMGFAF